MLIGPQTDLIQSLHITSRYTVRMCIPLPTPMIPANDTIPAIMFFHSSSRRVPIQTQSVDILHTILLLIRFMVRMSLSRLHQDRRYVLSNLYTTATN